jgi:hypothetical protein
MSELQLETDSDTSPLKPNNSTGKRKRQQDLSSIFSGAKNALAAGDESKHALKELYVNFEKKINADTPFLRQKSIAKLDPKDEKYQKFLKMNEFNTKLSLPTQEEKLAHSAAQKVLKLHMDTPEKDRDPDNFYREATMLRDKVLESHPKMMAIYTPILEASDAYHDCTLAIQWCHKELNIDAAAEWEALKKVIKNLGIDAILNEIKASRKSERDQKRERELKRRQAEGARRMVSSQVLANTDYAAEDIATIDGSDEVPEPPGITNMDGNVVCIDDVVVPGEDSIRARPRKLRVATGGKKASRSSVRKVAGTPMTSGQLRNLIRKDWRMNKTKSDGSKTFFSGSDKRGHGLTLRNKYLFCELCQKPLDNSKVGQHLAGDIHQKHYESEKEKRESNTLLHKSARSSTMVSATSEMAQQNRQLGLRGHSLSNDLVLYRVNVLKHALRANMSMGQLKKFAPALQLHGSPGMTLGDVKNMFGDVGRAVVQYIKDERKKTMSDRYYSFVTVADGSPVGANAEAILVIYIRRSDMKLMIRLISVRLFKASLTGENIANNLLKEIDKEGFEVADWIGCILDRAASNQKAIQIIHERNVCSVVNEPCHSHTFNLPGKELTKSCKLFQLFRKAYNTGIMHRGKMSHIIKNMFNKMPTVSGGVRWYVEWEQIVEMDSFGILRIVNELIPTLEALKLSTKSVNKMKRVASPENIPRLIVEAAAMADVGKLFCQSTYLLEGEDPLALTSWMVFEKMDVNVEDNLNMARFRPCTIAKCEYAAKLAKVFRDEKRSDVLVTIDLLLIDRDTLENEYNELQIELEHLTEIIEPAASTNQGRTRSRRAPIRFRENEEAERNEQRDQAQQRADDIRTRLEEAEESLRNIEDEIHDQNIMLNEKTAEADERLGAIITKQDFVQYAREKVKPVYDKYTKLYTVGTNLHRSKKAFYANKVFDILFLKTQPSIELLRQMVDNLSYHRVPLLNYFFLREMKKEIPKLVEMALDGSIFDFEEDANSTQYTKRLLSRAQRNRQRIAIQQAYADFMKENEGTDNDTLQWDMMRIHTSTENFNAVDMTNSDDIRFQPDWKKDPGERAHKIYKWWAKVILDSRGTCLPRFEAAFRTVVLKLPSSTPAERVFSQMNFARKVAGDKGLEDITRVRTMLRCDDLEQNGASWEEY